MKQIRFDGKFRLFLPLEAQSPMIHFQARETGATVRATEESVTEFFLTTSFGTMQSKG